MAYKEIVTKAVIGKGKKKYKDTYSEAKNIKCIVEELTVKQKTKTEVLQYIDKTPPIIKFLDFSSKTEKSQKFLQSKHPESALHV